MSFVPGVPSTAADILAASIKLVPSEPSNITAPNESPELTVVCNPTVAFFDLAKTKVGANELVLN